MSLNRISAAEAASLIKHGYNIGLSGFTPAGTAKAVTAELAKIAEAEHAKGNPFQVGIFTGASTGESCDGVLSRAKAIRYRAPYTTNADFRKAVNNGEIAYNDIHLSQMAQEVRYGFMGKVNVAIIEACEVTPDGKIYLTAAGGIAPTICRLADQIIVELNSAHSKSGMGMHDVYEPLDPPYRREIPIYKPSDRIGLPYVQVDPKKIIGVVETNWPDEARSFAAADPLTDKIGQNVADFLAADMKRGIIPSSFLPLQSGVGNIANAVLGALGRDKTIPAFEMYTEVIQNSVIGLIREGRIKFGSACSLTVTNDCLEGIYNDMDFFRDKLVLRPSEISNSPEIVRRLGIISINTAIEVDLYGNVNSTHIGGTKMMNGIGGSETLPATLTSLSSLVRLWPKKGRSARSYRWYPTTTTRSTMSTSLSPSKVLPIFVARARKNAHKPSSKTVHILTTNSFFGITSNWPVTGHRLHTLFRLHLVCTQSWLRVAI